MSTKYTYDNYVMTVDFKEPTVLSMTASDTYSGDIFMNEQVELTKITKDTVIAALTKKNEKNLRCKFNLVDVEPKKLIIAFEVNFDFLPPFTEYVSLDELEKKGNGLNKVESAELRSDIEELQKLIDNISCKESTIVKETTHNFSSKGEILSLELEKGSYLFELSGTFICATGGQKHELVFTLDTEGQKYQIEACMHTNGGYGYPYSIRRQFVLANRSGIKVTVQHKQGQTFNLHDNKVSFCPMIKVE